MKIDPDCIRDILLAIEEKSDGFHDFCVSAVGVVTERDTPNEYTQKYNKDELIYHIIQCNENGFFTNMRKSILGVYKIRDLSPEGHKFLNNIRDSCNWNKVKKQLLTAGSFSLKTLIEIAQNIAVTALSANLIK